MATWARSSAGTGIHGVILNKAGSPRHAAEVADSIDLPVLGTIGRDEAISVPSRHLGLVPAAERDAAEHELDRLAALIAELVDLDRLVEIAAGAPDLETEPWDPTNEVTAASERRPVVAHGRRPGVHVPLHRDRGAAPRRRLRGRHLRPAQGPLTA